MKPRVETHAHDVLIVGAGLAGTRAALEVAPTADVAVLTKVFPPRSHSATAQGGIAAALGNTSDDSTDEHMFDTVKGGDYLGDQDAIETLCTEAIPTVYELEHMGVPFSRLPNGKIAQRPFGGHSKPRICYAADRTGHVMLHTLYEQSLRQKVHYYSEYFVTQLLLEKGAVRGLVALDLKDTSVHVFQARALMLATGGAGRCFKITSNAHASTGDGMALAFREGLPLMDMEFTQLHPTGIYPLGILITEGARGEGGYLVNAKGERFMERYAPDMKDLAPRDVVSRAILTEIREGRGFEGKYVHLDLRHLGRDRIVQRLPEIRKFGITYAGVDCVDKPLPIAPTAHYFMGGIPTDDHSRVIRDEKGTPVDGLYAGGEVACESVHGGNRLGANSLVDTLVFGRQAGKHMVEYLKEAPRPRVSAEAGGPTIRSIERLFAPATPDRTRASEVREALQDLMWEDAPAFRDEAHLNEGLKRLAALRPRLEHVRLDDRSMTFNLELEEALEVGHMVDYSEAILRGALARKESRGAHARSDFPKRDDKNFLKHSLCFRTKGGGAEVRWKPVRITKFEPKERKY